MKLVTQVRLTFIVKIQFHLQEQLFFSFLSRDSMCCREPLSGRIQSCDLDCIVDIVAKKISHPRSNRVEEITHSGCAELRNAVFGLIDHWKKNRYCLIEKYDSTSSGVYFINILHTAFRLVDPKSVKIQLSHQGLFKLLGSTDVKAVRRTLIKLSLASPLLGYEST